ncbi:enoyl-CoA hydratase/isomerase family protein [Hyphococcus luteus]|uniref:Enoyl-CoA hydratase/isomerase family protein n=1 Tax=Hyphococcus luteus TaxID=2058213 RepID=A0A2S7K8C5_9PROT|nr:enoyl-CoA hydratase/isomerase family protein [Marinicaulis flavus]PQA88733.1 enoyl-CoA hydratase/isomerase family protein [Marinicaulis flavus]
MSEPLVKSHMENGVANVTLNRPDALNAFTPDLLKALIAALKEAEAKARVIVLCGAGRAFSAGVDLKLLQGATFENGKVDDIFDNVSFAAIDAIRHASAPVIAKVHGFCFTGALELALHADFILTTAETKFGDTHAKWGLRPSWGMSQNLARAVGVRRARELSFTAASFTGAEAERWGLANAAFPDKETLDAETAKRAAAIAAASPGAVAAYKDLYRLAEENPALETALAEEQRRDYPEITDTAARLKGFSK